MKIRIELDENLIEEEIIIRSSSMNDEIMKIQKLISEAAKTKQQFVFYKGDMEYFLPLEEILFFDTEGNTVNAHTRTEMYRVKYKLYELEELLPGYFMRISKSSILNIKEIYAIERSLSSSSIVQFQHTHKQVYVSRNYYKPLRDRLKEKR